MKKALGLFLLYLTVGFVAFGQNTTVSGTIVDSDGTTWANGSWNATLINPNGGNVFYCNSTTPVQTRWPLTGSSALDGSGHFSQVMADNTQVCPSGTSWQFTFASNTSAAASQIPSLSISGATFSISTYATANIKAPRIQASPTAYAYTDGEIFPVPTPGGYYFNVTSQAGRQWNGSAWQGFVYNSWNGGTVTNPINYPGGNIGTFGYAPNGMIDPRNSLFGCKGDGTTDDSACLTTWFQYSVTHRGPILYLPTPQFAGNPSCYYVNSPLNWGGFSGSVIVYGDGRDLMDTSSTALPSSICYGTGITSTQPVIDGSNHGTLIIDGISVYPKNGTLSAGACILVQPDNTGGTTSATITHNNLQCGSGSSSEAVAVIASDVSTVTHNSIRSGGWGIVIGQQNGPSAVRSTFYTPVTGYGVTHVSALDNDVRTSYPPFEGTGNCGDYLIGDTAGTGYLVETSNVDTTHGGLDFSYTAGNSCPGFYLNLLAVNVESQGGGFPAAVVTGPVGNGNPYVNGGVWTGRLAGGATTIAGNFEGVYATISGGNTAMSDSTNFVTGLLSDANHYLHLSPNAATGGFTGNISGSTIVGYHGDFNTPTTILGYLSAVPYQSNVQICTSGNPFGGAETCARGGTGYEPGVSTGGWADTVSGVVNFTSGGHIAWQDEGNCTMTAGACAAINLTGNYYVSPRCFSTWTGTGILTGIVKAVQAGSGSAWTLTISSSINTDTAQIRYACLGH